MIKKSISLTLIFMLLYRGTAMAIGPSSTPGVELGLRPRAAGEREARDEIALDEKIRIVGEKHRESRTRMLEKYSLHNLIYSMTDPDSAEDTIRWLSEHDYLDSGKKFCDPFMGDGLLVHLAQVMTGADSTGYEKDPRVHQEAVVISRELSELDVVDSQRIHLIQGDCRSWDVSFKSYDVFYILPPYPDGVPDPMLVGHVILDMKIGAVMFLVKDIVRNIELDSIYYKPLHLEEYIEKIADIGGGAVYRRISKSPVAEISGDLNRVQGRVILESQI